MRYLILSDIHANWEALEAVTDDASGAYDAVLCLGDLVGYCADPNRVVDWVRSNSTSVVRGNHDKACAGLEDLEWFNPVARTAALWTMQALTPELLLYLRGLPQGPVCVEGFQIFHGSPLDEDEYLVSAYDAGQLATYLQSDLGFFGHTHLQGGFLCHRNGVKRLDRPAAHTRSRTVELDPRAQYLINPGSVGQPRDGDPRAAFAIYDSKSRAVEFRRVPYDLRACQAKILEARLPELLAHRLEVGT